MASETDEHVAKIESIDTDSPSLARRQVARVFLVAAEADAAVFCKYGIGEDDRYYTTIEAVGTEPLLEVLTNRGDSWEPADRPGWDPEDPPREAIGRFRARSGDDASQEAGSGYGTPLENFWPSDQLRHTASALLYDGAQFLGWLAVFRVEDPPFDGERVEELDSLLESAVDVLAAAENRERELIGERPAHVLLASDGSRIECATPNGFDWLNGRRVEKLTSAAEGLGTEESLPTKLNVEGFQVWIDAMEGDLGRYYLASVQYPNPPKLALEYVLTPRQREVVGYAAAGATNSEIAETLEISTDTVSDHLSESYRRLGVANRVELARKVAESE